MYSFFCILFLEAYSKTNPKLSEPTATKYVHKKSFSFLWLTTSTELVINVDLPWQMPALCSTTKMALRVWNALRMHSSPLQVKFGLILGDIIHDNCVGVGAVVKTNKMSFAIEGPLYNRPCSNQQVPPIISCPSPIINGL